MMASLLGARGGALGQQAGSFLRSGCDTMAPIWQLEEHLKACIAARDYGAAQHISGQLRELKQQQERHTLEALTAQQANERAATESAFAHARQQLNHKWQQHMTAVQDQLMQAQQHLVARQEEETAHLLATQMSSPLRPRFTPHLLNMRRVEHTLAEQRDFTRAHQVKQEADRQELLELQCIDAGKLAKWELERTALASQHAREQAAADKKVASTLLELQMSQQQELEQLTRRFQATQLSMAHTHASQQLKAATALRGTLGLPKASSLLNLPSFNTSLAPGRGLVAPLPATPAEACKPSLFQDLLSDRQCHQGPSTQGPQQPIMATMLSSTPNNGYSSSAGIVSVSKCGQKCGAGLLPSNGSTASIGTCLGSNSSRGGSPARRGAGCLSTPRGRGVSEGVSGGILSSRSGSPPHRMPLSHGMSHGVIQGLGSVSRISPFTTGPVQSQMQQQQQHQHPSLCYSSSSAQVPVSTACSPGSPARHSISPARMPHPPCQPSTTSNRPCSPAVRIRARSPPPRQAVGSTFSSRGQDRGLDGSGAMSGAARFPSRSQHTASVQPVSCGLNSPHAQEQQVSPVLQEPARVGMGRLSDACGLVQQGLLPVAPANVQTGTEAAPAAPVVFTAFSVGQGCDGCVSLSEPQTADAASVEGGEPGSVGVQLCVQDADSHESQSATAAEAE